MTDQATPNHDPLSEKLTFADDRINLSDWMPPYLATFLYPGLVRCRQTGRRDYARYHDARGTHRCRPLCGVLLARR